MADTINTNSFFNQPEGEGGGISSVQVLAQNAFDISTTVRTQFNNFVQTFNTYKLDAGESDRLISNTVSDLDIKTDEINKTLEEFKKNFEALEDDIGGQDDKIKVLETTIKQIQESQKAAAEKAADDAFRAQDAAQKSGDKKEDGGAAAAGLGGLGGMFGGGDKGSGGGGDEEKEKPPNFWKNPWMWGLMGAGALHGMGAGISGGIKRGVGGYADFMTGGLFDFDKRSGGGGLRKIGGGLKNMFGGKDKPKGSSSGILGTISSDPKDMVNMPEDTKEESVETEVDDLESRVNALESGDPPPKDSKKTSKLSKEFKFGKNTYDLSKPLGGLSREEFEALGNRERDMLLRRLRTYADQNPEERHDDIKNNETSPKEGTDEKGLEPISEEGEKKEKGLFGGFFGGLFGKKEDKDTKEEKGSKGREMVVYRGDAGAIRMIKGTGVDALSKEEAKSEFLSLKEKDVDRTGRENFRFRALSVVLNDKFGVNTRDIQTNVDMEEFGGRKDEMGLIVKEGTEKGLEPKGEGTTTEKDLKPTGEPTGESKSKGGGLKNKLAGAADFMTGGMFDFDNKNRKGAPKDFGIRRMAGGIADTMTGGLTDFDKRGKGNLQVNPLFGGKDKAWGAADEQAKRGEKQSGMGIKRGIGGALDFATLGTFDFDKQNKKGSPKGWGLKRIAGGLADAATMGLTDFDKRGAGLLQFDAISGGKSTSSKTDKSQTSERQPSITEKYLTDMGMDLTKPQGGLSHEEYTALKPQIRNLLDRHLRISNLRGELNTEISSVPSGSGKNFQKLSQPLESEGDGTPEVLPIQMVEGDNTASNVINQMAADKGDFSTDDDTADGTECTIECINMMKANSVRLIKF